jgi:hypothetical protein
VNPRTNAVDVEICGMKGQVLPDLDPQRMAELDAMLLEPTGRLKLLPASCYEAINPMHLRIWAQKRARYLLVTAELVAWLGEFLDAAGVVPGEAIEVGAGQGDLGGHLGISMSDNGCQQRPEVKAFYEAIDQAPTFPPPHVRRLDAVGAVEKFRPKAVVASWLTRKFIAGVDRPGKAEASIYGAEEEKILAATGLYIHIGNALVHRGKTILARPHETYRFPWLVSRSRWPQEDCIWVWKQDRGGSR